MSEEIISETIRRIGPEGPEGGYILVGTIREGRLYLAERQGKDMKMERKLVSNLK